ncbi:hypothetical protein PWT90_00707 [Aphanocladium album]|nr:hypothetical protein PWT90_00707 [Aphanocladium album]
MFNAIVLTSVLATVASASMIDSPVHALAHRQADAAPVTVTNTVTVTASDCGAPGGAAISTKYITVCTEQSASPVGTSAPPPPPAPPAPAPSSNEQPRPPPAITATVASKNITILEQPARSTGKPVKTSADSTVAIPSSSTGAATTSSSCPPGGCDSPRVSRASANSASLAAGVAMVVATLSLF